MKVVFLLLMLLPIPTFAVNWIFAGDLIDKGKAYLDQSSIKKLGNTAQVMMKQNLGKRFDGALSYKSTIEINCKMKDFRVLSVTHYDDLDFMGSVTYLKYKPSDWFPITDGGEIFINAYKISCN